VRVTEHQRLDGIEDMAQWESLFGNHPDSLAIARLTQDCGMDGFEFGSIIVRDGERPVLCLPWFEVRFRLASLLDGAAGWMLGAIGRVMPGLLAPKLLGVGLVEGEWSQVGIAADLDESSRQTAWQLGLEALERRAKDAKAKLIVLLNFTPAAVQALPAKWAASLARIDTIPCAQLKIEATTIEEYLRRLSKATRKDLRRKLKAAEGLSIVRSTQIDPWLDRIESLYKTTLNRAELSLGIQRRSFFQRVCAAVPGAHFVLYFRNEELLAFNLLVEERGMLIDKYFCMDETAGRELSLYFISWMENVRRCCATGLALYHAGPGAEATKARLGATFIPSITLFRHRNPIAHRLLSMLRPMLAYRPAVTLPP
jgi:hypothetical protein